MRSGHPQGEWSEKLGRASDGLEHARSGIGRIAHTDGADHDLVRLAQRERAVALDEPIPDPSPVAFEPERPGLEVGDQMVEVHRPGAAGDLSVPLAELRIV